MHNVTLTPGLLNPAAEHAFLHGACAALALALHEATGWPLVAITDAHNVHSGRVGGGSCLHYGVRRPIDGAFIDVLGAHTDAEITDQYGADADDGHAAIGITTVADVTDWYVEAQGEPVPIDLARTFTTEVLARLQPTRATCRHCQSTIRQLDIDTLDGVGPDADGRNPRPGDWAEEITGIDCPGTDDRRHTPIRKDTA